MAEYLVYWKHFWQDEEGRRRPEEHPDWYTDRESFYRRVRPGDTLWVVVSGGPRARDEWRLLQQIDVLERDPSLAQSPYGRYHIIADPSTTRTFALSSQEDLAPLLRRLTFTTDKPIVAKGGLIGRALQAIRELSVSDQALLAGYSLALREVGA